MSDRFERLYALPAPLYEEHAPLLISAGTLLKDTQTGKVLAQLKLKNIGDKVIKAVYLSLVPLDTVMKPLGGKESFRLLDLSASRGAEFGQKTPLYFSDAATRAYQVTVEKVAFADNSVWESGGKAAALLPAQQSAGEVLADGELAKQYTLEYGAAAVYMADTAFDLWRCRCGAVNHEGEGICHACGTDKSAALGFDREALQRACSARLEQERKAAETALAAKAAAAKRRKKLTLVLLSAVIVCALLAFLSIRVIIPKIQGKIQLAKMTDYAAAEIGDCVCFGRYEQDNNTADGEENIEWLVLAEEDNRLLLISKYALDCQPYNTSQEDTTWESCSLRKWMNDTFLNNAFRADEQAKIQSAAVDKVFLLSIAEAEKYFSSDEDRMCVPTAYAIAQGAWTPEHYGKGDIASCLWWLRSTARYGYDNIYNIAACGCDDGSIRESGCRVDTDYVCVRPAMWISID